MRPAPIRTPGPWYGDATGLCAVVLDGGGRMVARTNPMRPLAQQCADAALIAAAPAMFGLVNDTLYALGRYVETIDARDVTELAFGMRLRSQWMAALSAAAVPIVAPAAVDQPPPFIFRQA